MEIPWFMVGIIGERTVNNILNKGPSTKIDWEKKIKKSDIPYNHVHFLLINLDNNHPKKERSIKFLREHLEFMIKKFPQVYSQKDLNYFDEWSKQTATILQ